MGRVRVGLSPRKASDCCFGSSCHHAQGSWVSVCRLSCSKHFVTGWVLRWEDIGWFFFSYCPSLPIVNQSPSHFSFPWRFWYLHSAFYVMVGSKETMQRYCSPLCHLVKKQFTFWSYSTISSATSSSLSSFVYIFAFTPIQVFAKFTSTKFTSLIVNTGQVHRQAFCLC